MYSLKTLVTITFSVNKLTDSVACKPTYLSAKLRCIIFNHIEVTYLQILHVLPNCNNFIEKSTEFILFA